VKLEVEVITCPFHSVFNQLNIGFSYLGWFMPEDICNLLFNNRQITLVDFCKQTKRKHVFTKLRIVQHFKRFFLDWNLDKTIVF